MVNFHFKTARLTGNDRKIPSEKIGSSWITRYVCDGKNAENIWREKIARKKAFSVIQFFTLDLECASEKTWLVFRWNPLQLLWWKNFRFQIFCLLLFLNERRIICESHGEKDYSVNCVCFSVIFLKKILIEYSNFTNRIYPCHIIC